VQSVLQFGTVEQKETILASLCAKASEIAKTPYGHFTILKAVTYCTRAVDQRKIVAALKGHFVSLGGNVIGSRTVESVLQLYPHTLTRNLKAEFYGQVNSIYHGDQSVPCFVLPSALNFSPFCFDFPPRFRDRNSACCCPRLLATCTR
jgi:hypothetical protein